MGPPRLEKKFTVNFLINFFFKYFEQNELFSIRKKIYCKFFDLFIFLKYFEQKWAFLD